MHQLCTNCLKDDDKMKNIVVNIESTMPIQYNKNLIFGGPENADEDEDE